MRTTARYLWLSTGALSLLALGIGIYLLFKTPPPSTAAPVVIPTTPPPAPSFLASAEPPPVANPQLDLVDYPPGSIGAACEVNEFPPYHWEPDPDHPQHSYSNDPYSAIEDPECFDALERHLYAINPYLWGTQDDKHVNANRTFSFIVIDNPLTFERIFKDPVGDLARVQDAFARPECQLGQDADPDWQLSETCHADSILNYALLTRFCYNNMRRNNHKNGVVNRDRQFYWEDDNPTPAQDRSMWIQFLEGDWIREKCDTLDPTLNLHSELHTELQAKIHSLAKGKFDATLINLAARLGDAAAALTSSSTIRPGRHIYNEQGHKYGSFADMFSGVFSKLNTKHAPSVDRFRPLLPLFSQRVGVKGKRTGIKGNDFVVFDQEALVQHLCKPPYYAYPTLADIPTAPPPPSCRSVIADLRLEYHDNKIYLELIATFEDVAMRLDVYE